MTFSAINPACPKCGKYAGYVSYNLNCECYGCGWTWNEKVERWRRRVDAEIEWHRQNTV